MSSSEYNYNTIPGIFPTQSSVTHIHNGQKPINRTTESASEEVPVATYESYWSAIIIPENAGGRAPATTSIARLSGVILKMIPTMSSNAGITTSLRIDPRMACQLMVIFTVDNVTPAANTAIEALAPFIRSNDGLSHWGQGIPAITHITASIGAHATGCSSAWITGFHGLYF